MHWELRLGVSSLPSFCRAQVAVAKTGSSFGWSPLYFRTNRWRAGAESTNAAPRPLAYAWWR